MPCSTSRVRLTWTPGWPLIPKPLTPEASAGRTWAVRLQLERAGSYRGMMVALAHREFAALAQGQWQGMLERGAAVLEIQVIMPRQLGPIRL